MDDLTIALNKCNTGCVIGSTTINHIMYADDFVILSPSVSGLCELMQVCGLWVKSSSRTIPRRKVLC